MDHLIVFPLMIPAFIVGFCVYDLMYRMFEWEPIALLCGVVAFLMVVMAPLILWNAFML